MASFVRANRNMDLCLFGKDTACLPNNLDGGSCPNKAFTEEPEKKARPHPESCFSWTKDLILRASDPSLGLWPSSGWVCEVKLP